LKGEILALSQDLRWDKNVMDNIWDPSKLEVIGCCGADEKTNDHAEQRSIAKKNIKKYI